MFDIGGDIVVDELAELHEQMALFLRGNVPICNATKEQYNTFCKKGISFGYIFYEMQIRQKYIVGEAKVKMF